MLLRRLRDPETSTRRTLQARERLVAHPMTTALLDAGVSLLLAELEPRTPVTDAPRPGADRVPPALFFGCLSASRVCAAATRVGPLRVTAAHLRDRWPRQDDFVDDLLSHALWFEHHFAGAVQQAQALHAAVPAGATAWEVAGHLAQTNLYSLRAPVTSRVEVLSCALTASRPWLRAVQQRNYAVYDSAWHGVLAPLLLGLGLRLRPGVGAGDLARAVGSLGEGVSLRFTALGESALARDQAVDAFQLGFTGLVGAWTEPLDDDDGGGAGGARPVDPTVPVSPVPRTGPAEVLLRLVDPVTGTRSTAATRRRLAEDGITAQLLEGGLAVLGEEFGVAASVSEPRFFSSVSAARVVEQARAVGHAATAAQLRDRWALQEHYVDDLVGWALFRAGLLSRGPQLRPGEDAAAAADRDAAAVHRRLRQSEGSPDFRLRLLLTTMAARTSIVDDFAQQHEEADAAILAHTRSVLEGTGARLADGVVASTFARAALAIAHGEITRSLATGDDGVRADQPAIARASRAFLDSQLA